MNKDLKFIADVVKEASLLIKEDFNIYQKANKGDIVTNCDYEVEKYIMDKIKENYSSFDIVSEEFNSKKELTKNCFTIDPIDGTINFANGIPLWGIQIACIRDGKTCAAVIYLPKLNELYTADENGAYLNGKKIHVNDKSIEEGLYAVEESNRVIGMAKMQHINPNHRNYYCSSVNFSWVACGRLSAAILRKNSLWDYVPGQFLVEKAGGFIENVDGAHIAANSVEFLQVLKENARFDSEEKLKIIKESI